MIEIVNEPVQNAGQVGTLTSSYYPNAFTVRDPSHMTFHFFNDASFMESIFSFTSLTLSKTIRAAEAALGITSNNFLHIQMMNNNWGSGQPTQFLTNNFFAAYDDHRYLKFSSVTVSQAAYIASACSDTSAGGNTPTIVGEFSLSPPTDVQDSATWNVNTQQAFYKKWFAAATTKYESESNGWIFWSWKTDGLNDYRWDYSAAVAAKVIPTTLGEGSAGIC